MHCIHCKLCIDFHIFVQYPLFYFIDAFLMFVFFIFSFSTSIFFSPMNSKWGFSCVFKSHRWRCQSVILTSTIFNEKSYLKDDSSRPKHVKAHCVITVQWAECCSRIVGVLYEDVYVKEYMFVAGS